PLILTQTSLKSQLPETDAVVICLDAISDLNEQANSPEPVKSSPEDLAYVMYTSGSTGKPKGVCVPHRAVIRLVKDTDYAQFDDQQTFLQYAPISFDASTLEIWGALLHGAKLVVMPAQEKTLDALANVLQQQKITVLWLTSSLFNVMIEDFPDALKTVKQLLTGGEALSLTHVQKALELLPDTQLINGYGPTENTTFTCCYAIQKQQYNRSIPIGRPINGSQVFIVDKNLQPMPIGYVGELVTSGAGLARGYLNQPQLTAEKFVEIDLFGKKQRVYKTGDLARWLPGSDGGPATLEFVGRVDHQVKLRGLRIELGEIERTLTQHAGVQDNVVLCTQDDNTQDKRILAYVVADQNNQQHSEDVVQQSSEQIVAQWEEVFDSEYQGQSEGQSTSQNEDHSFNLSGWISSYTGNPIAPNEMQQWVDNTVASITSLKPAALVEIGCGTGLLLSRIAPHCQTYLGCDLSSVVLEKVAQLKRQQTDLHHVELHQNSADDFSQIEQGRFD
ncbi:MAG: amino acid adenylation domain-containing protein, partial [Psychrosphaera sp.]|nr:amino acid adenylation domain-containing protein [Psychrosphaera sp.]